MLVEKSETVSTFYPNLKDKILHGCNSVCVFRCFSTNKALMNQELCV